MAWKEKWELGGGHQSVWQWLNKGMEAEEKQPSQNFCTCYERESKTSQKSLKGLAKAKDVPACLRAVVCYNAMHTSVCWESCLPASACAFQTSPQQKAILKMSFAMEACIPKHTKSGHEQHPKATGWPYQVYCSGPNSAGDVPHPKEPHLHCQGM